MKITEAKLRQIIREELSQDAQLNEMIGGLSQATSSLKKLSVGQGTPRDRQALEKQLVAQQIERSSPTPGDISYEEHTKEFLDALLDAEELDNMTTVDKLYVSALDFLQGHSKALKAEGLVMASLPFKQHSLSADRLLREFSRDVPSDELVWHRDREARTVRALEGRGWALQLDGGLPQPIRLGEAHHIPAGTWHRLLRRPDATTLRLVVEIKKGDRVKHDGKEATVKVPDARGVSTRRLGPDDLEKVIRDHEAWVASDGRKGQRANLTGFDLSGANLVGADLAGVNLTRANLSGANMALTNLARANLSEADLTGANLARANLSEADLTGANLSEVNLFGANLRGANLSGADLTGADLTGATGAHLPEADLIRAQFELEPPREKDGGGKGKRGKEGKGAADKVRKPTAPPSRPHKGPKDYDRKRAKEIPLDEADGAVSEAEKKGLPGSPGYYVGKKTKRTKSNKEMAREIEKCKKEPRPKSCYDEWTADKTYKEKKKSEAVTDADLDALLEAVLSEEDLTEGELSKQTRETLKKKAEKANMPLGALTAVYRKGLAAWLTGHRQGVPQHAWAMGRVNSFISGGKARSVDKAEWKKVQKHRK